MKNTFFVILFILASLCAGCATFFSGLDLPVFPVKEGEFQDFAGRRYEVVSPLLIKRYSDSWSSFLSKPTSFISKRIVAHVPAGSIIVMDHVSKGHSFALQAIGFDPKFYCYIARLENSKIFKGKFIVDYLMIFEKGEFVGMDSNYLVEIQE